MLNFYYSYSILGCFILLICSFEWTTFTSNITTELWFFLIITSIISLIIGKILKKKFKFEKLDTIPKHKGYLTYVLVLLCLFEYVVCQQIPFFSIVQGTASYKSYKGISGFHPLLISFCVFYMQYLFYLYINFPKKKKFLNEYIALFIVSMLFQFNRGGMIINLMMSSIMYIASITNEKKNKLSPKLIVVSIIIIIIFLYIFGGLGNLRTTGVWSDSSYIEFYGRFNENYPQWLPKQFMWAYLYITTPVNNLNINILNNYCQPDTIAYLSSFLPDFVSKRICPDLILDPVLIDINFNATVGYGIAYMNGGILGMYFMFFYLFGGTAFLLSIKILKPKKKYRVVYIAIIFSIVILTYFTHTISYSAISFPLIYPLISCFSVNSIRKYRQQM